MRKTTLRQRFLAGSAAMLVAIASGVAIGIIPDPILPTASRAYGKSYGAWSGAWWKWGIETPITAAGHPFWDATGELVGVNQSGKVWFVAAPFEVSERSYAIPRGTALFVAQMTTECSSAEVGTPWYGGTAEEQSACAKQWVDYVQDVFFEVDGIPVPDISVHRVQSPQFSFEAPEANILGVASGPGTGVSDGYFVFVTPLSVGEHTLHYGGRFVDTPFGTFGSDVTDHVTVE